ncbi:hypothetical protein HYZ97_03540 [Candidatus Pacearchaeota archaeon]|nr:hypothetical protein [Candidatus Pacearchaeota archaeon]
MNQGGVFPEPEHVSSVLKEARKALLSQDAVKLRELSNQIIHSTTCSQDASHIAAVVLIYAVGKVIERQDYQRIKNWDSFAKRFAGFLELAAQAMQDNNPEAFERHITSARTAFSSISISLKPYIEEVLKKASLNKAGKIYEHGISLGQTAQMLGITQWELAEYAGQAKSEDAKYNTSLNVKKRAEMALEFFS